MAHLEDALALAGRGEEQVVAVVGDPGVGEIAPVLGVRALTGVDGCLVPEATSVSYGKTMAYAR
jgi:hypothetical protein